jgi:hypothetical protein
MVRHIEDILDDPWFAGEAGQPSIVAFVKKVPVGDHVLAAQGQRDDVWQGGQAKVVQNALRQDGHVVDPPIRPNKGWRMELMSGDTPNITRVSNWGSETELNCRDRRARD